MKFIFQYSKKVTYDLARFMFWRLPPSARQLLHGPRHKVVRWARGNKSNRLQRNMRKRNPNDLTWEEFNSNILSRRNEFKGLFIQESILDWNSPLYQRPQHLASAFGRLGYLVIYKTDNWANDDVEGVREVAENVWITNSWEVNKIDNVVRSLYSTGYSHTPKSILDNGKRGIVVYEYVDHIDPQINGDSENIRRLIALKDFAFKGGADFVVASASKLEKEAINAVGSGKVILIPNGVDTRHYRNSIHSNFMIPANLLSFRNAYNNIVGYFGALAPWLWYEAITDLIQFRSDIGFVFIGPDYNGGSVMLPKAKNVLYLGAVDYKILPAYARLFDVCFIPFSPGEIAKTTSPLKLFEYFALEKPVVVTSDMHECTAFEEVFSGDSAMNLSSAIDEALLVKDDLEYKARLAQLANENDWDERARAMAVVFKAIK